VANRKVIAVVGATGAQGGGLVRALARDAAGGFAARAVTRDPRSARARALADGGIEVVAADADDPSSLVRAFEGAHGAFCVTSYFEHFSPARETAQARHMAEAAKEAGVAHVVWSTLEDTRRSVPLDDQRLPTLMEHYKVPHLDSKGEANRYFIDLGLATTFLLTSFYWENLIYAGAGPKKQSDGSWTLSLPIGGARLAGIGVEDIGKCAYGIFKVGVGLAGHTIGVAGEHLTGAELAESLSRALGVEVRHDPLSPEVYRTLGFPGAEDLANMFQFFRDFEEDVCQARDVERARSFNPELQTFDQWLATHKSQIPLE
jgi:uncharacterized protein YbjT (DUF2867 family)